MRRSRFWVNGKPYKGDPAKIDLAAHADIVIEAGPPFPKPAKALHDVGTALARTAGRVRCAAFFWGRAPRSTVLRTPLATSSNSSAASCIRLFAAAAGVDVFVVLNAAMIADPLAGLK